MRLARSCTWLCRQRRSFGLDVSLVKPSELPTHSGRSSAPEVQVGAAAGADGGVKSSAPSTTNSTDITRQIQRVVSDLVDIAAGDSKYLDRLRRGLDRASVDIAVMSLQKELHQEMASALGRSGRTVDLRFLQLELAEQALAAGTGSAEAVGAAHAAALNARHELIIHRVAIGMRGDHQTEFVEEMWPLEPLGRSVKDKDALFRSEVTAYLQQHGISTLFRRVSAALHARRGVPLDGTLLESHLARLAAAPNRHLREAAEERTSVAAVLCMLESVDAFEASDAAETVTGAAQAPPRSGGDGCFERTEALQALFTDVVSTILIRLHKTQPADPLGAVRAHLRERIGMRVVGAGAAPDACPSALARCPPSALYVVAAHGAVEETPAQGPELSQAGRSQLNTLGAWLRATRPAWGADGRGSERLGRAEDVYVRALRFWPALLSAEALLHGVARVDPLPTKRSRSNLEMRYNFNDLDGQDGLRYECALASADGWNAEFAPRVNIFSSRLSADTDTMLNGGAVSARGGARGTVTERSAGASALAQDGAELMLSEIEARLARSVASPAARRAARARASRRALANDNVPALRERCRAAELRVGGTRAELVARIVAHERACDASASDDFAAASERAECGGDDDHELARPWQQAPSSAALQMWVGAESVVRTVAQRAFGAAAEASLGAPTDGTSVAITIDLLSPVEERARRAARRATVQSVGEGEFSARLSLVAVKDEGVVVVAERTVAIGDRLYIK